MKTTISKLKDFEGKEVSLNGWVYNMRSIGKIWFLILRDGTGLVQCVVVKAETEKEVFELENINSFTEKDWQELYKLSENTFVEETEELKKSAAGAGLTDND